MSSYCCKCNSVFDELDTPIKCDGCNLLSHSICSGLTANEIKCFSLKNRRLRYFCETCNNSLRDIPEMKQLINRVLDGVNELKNQKNINNVPHRSEELIINDVGERNTIFYNVPESISVNTTDRIAHGSNQDIIKNSSPVRHGLGMQLTQNVDSRYKKRLDFCQDLLNKLYIYLSSRANEEANRTFHYPSLINDRPSTDIVNQFPSPPVYSGKGMMLILKMGWKPGDKIGKPQSGSLDPVLLNIIVKEKGLLDIPDKMLKCKKGYFRAEEKQNIHQLSKKSEIKGNCQIPSSSKADDELKQLAKCSTALYCNKGMQLMLKMGWSPGERLGKNQCGLLEPISALKVKLDKKGLISADEKSEKIKESICVKPKKSIHHTLPERKKKKLRPIAVLMSLCYKSRWNCPKFVELDRTGPLNEESFLSAISVNKVWYCSWKFQKTQKLAKEDAVKQCLMELGVPIS